MLSPREVEKFLDESEDFKCVKKIQKEAIYETAIGSQLALERTSTNGGKFYLERSFAPGKLSFSESTRIEWLSSDTPRVHLSASRLKGPYNNRNGSEAWRVWPGSATDLAIVLSAYSGRPAENLKPESDRVVDDASTILQMDDDESAYPEGTEAYRLHLARERDPSLARRAKERELSRYGNLRCGVCGFDFFAFYGNLGEGFIEAHHVKPISRLDGTSLTSIADLALVCSNCHRMLHRSNPLLSPIQLREKLNTKR